MTANGTSGYEVVFLRHGETHGYDGDHGLTARGERQARDAGAALAGELKPGTVVVLPHARTARGTATAVVLRAALRDALGDAAAEGDPAAPSMEPDPDPDRITVGPPYPEPWFDNLRFALHGEVVDTSVAITERLAMTDGAALPDWAREYDRFDTDYRAAAAAGDPIEFWLHTPTFWFEPPHVGAHRLWRGVAALGEHPAAATGRLVALVATHSAPLRAFATGVLGADPGEPANLEDVRVRVRGDGAADVVFRGATVPFTEPPPLPPWIDAGWFAAYGRG